MAPSISNPTSAAAATGDKSKRSKRNLLDDSDSDSDDGGAAIEAGFKVNEEYAKRFEYNKKREEREKLEEKLKKQANGEDSDDSSTDETEDEDGFLATEDLDAQISATLNAIRSKDPSVYDKNVTFYKAEDDADKPAKDKKKEKAVTLRDYQREKIMRGDVGASDDEEDAPPQTYAQEQDALKDSLLNAAQDEDDEEDDDDDDDDFIKRKEPAKADANGVHPSRAKAVQVSDVDVANADKDPETFLSNFMASRAWVTDEGSKWEAFESDEGEDDDRADEFEQAYNMRFEDPEKSNEVLRSYARDMAASRSVRREEKTGRKRQRELEKERKEEEKRARREDKARLRKLKLDETEEKLRKIKHAAGASGQEIELEEWMKFLDDAWEDERWEDEMKKRFGEDYYTVKEGEEGEGSEDEAEGDGEKKKKKKKSSKIKKPTWDDDIDIKDLVPDFEDEGTSKAQDDDDDDNDDKEEEEEGPPSKKRKASDHKRARQETQKKARHERAQLEALVDAKLQLEDHDLLKPSSSRAASGSGSGSGGSGFRYRETSPQSFGMTARDILLAPSDKVLNEYAGLKKLASFRDVEKKRRDKKKLGKKARLRQWRRDVFGREYEQEGPTYGFEGVRLEDGGEDEQQEKAKGRDKGKGKGKGKEKEGEGGSNIVGEVDGRKKRKRSKGKKEASTA